MCDPGSFAAVVSSHLLHVVDVVRQALLDVDIDDELLVEVNRNLDLASNQSCCTVIELDAMQAMPDSRAAVIGVNEANSFLQEKLTR